MNAVEQELLKKIIVSNLVVQGESLLDDDGVDEQVAEGIADDIICEFEEGA